MSNFHYLVCDAELENYDDLGDRDDENISNLNNYYKDWNQIFSELLLYPSGINLHGLNLHYLAKYEKWPYNMDYVTEIGLLKHFGDQVSFLFFWILD